MGVVLGFLPFLMFAALKGVLGAADALAVATLTSIVLVGRATFIQKKSLKLLEGGSLLLFGGLAIAARLPQAHLSIAAVKLWVDGGLFAIVLVSLAVRRPFTLQYAREQVTAEIARHPRFFVVNIKLTAVWALAFAASVCADLAMLAVKGFSPAVGTAIGLAAMAAAALYTVRVATGAPAVEGAEQGL